MGNYITEKYHKKRIAELEAEINNQKCLLDTNEAIVKDALRDRDYYKRISAEKQAKLDEIAAKNNQAVGCEQARRDKLLDAAVRANAELGQVKANEDQCTILQRAIGNAQGILAVAIGNAPGIDLYPADAPPRRRSSDHIMDAAPYFIRKDRY